MIKIIIMFLLLSSPLLVMAMSFAQVHAKQVIVYDPMNRIETITYDTGVKLKYIYGGLIMSQTQNDFNKIY